MGVSGVRVRGKKESMHVEPVEKTVRVEEALRLGWGMSHLPPYRAVHVCRVKETA